jgi:hypothetical protein
MKKVWLKRNDEVYIIHKKDTGFTKEKAKFKEYRSIEINGTQHQTPVFEDDSGKEILGIDCFWVLSSLLKDDNHLQFLQKEILRIQYSVLETAAKEGYTIPSKVADKEIEAMATENAQRTQAIIQKFGFDPRDEKWIEDELAHTLREKNWFKFERENSIIFSNSWEDIVTAYNQKYHDSISIETAKSMSKRRMRYILGSHQIRFSGKSDKKEWIMEAKSFETKHSGIEQRMIEWSLSHKNKFPLVRVKKPVQFDFGSYFNQCVEKVPHIFTEANCRFIKEDIVLRAVSYDKQTKYMRLDFTEDVCKIIKGKDSESPWIKEEGDYDIKIFPVEIETHLEILDSLE